MKSGFSLWSSNFFQAIGIAEGPANPALTYPALIEPIGRCPPEDVGGPPGYEEFLAALRRPRSQAPCHGDSFATISSHSKCNGQMGFPDPAVSTGFVHQLLSALPNIVDAACGCASFLRERHRWFEVTLAWIAASLDQQRQGSALPLDRVLR